MSYFAAGAWWSDTGMPFATQAEAEQYEASQQGSAEGDAFAQATGAAPRSPSRGGGQTPAPQAGRTGAKGSAAPADPQSRNFSPVAEASRATAGSGTGFYEDPLGKGLSTAAGFYNNPVVNTIPWAAGQVGKVADRAVGNVFDRAIDGFAQGVVSPRTNVATDLRPSVSGYIQDPAGQFLNDIGAPKGVQAIANPTGLLARTGVSSATSYGLNPAAVLQEGRQTARDVANDFSAIPSTVGAAGRTVANAVNNAANAAGGYINGIGSAFGGARPASNAPAYQPAPLPQPGMTPQQIMGMNTNTVRPSSAQQDALVQQMVAQSQVQSPYQNFSSPQYDQSRGTVNQITGQLQAQANNNVADIQANSAQRDQSRNAVMDTATALTGNAGNNIGPILADQSQRIGLGAGVDQSIGALRASAGNDVGDIYADTTRYDESRGTSNDVIQRLLAASQLPEGPSAAESLMLNAQERAIRNAYGDAGSLGGGWRSQLTGQRRALGQAATMQSDIAAELGALRASEEAANRDRQLNALGLAGGFSGDMGGRDLSLAQSDAALLAQIRQGNQSNMRLSNEAAGNLGLGRLQDETGFITNEADRRATTEMANQRNALDSLLGAGNLQTGAMVSDTGLAQSNASLLAQIRQGNQANSLASLTAAGNNAGQVLNADANIGMSDADRRATVDQNNRANAIQALQNAGVLSSNTRAQDVQLSVQDSQALTSRINSAAGLAGTVYASQIDAAMKQQDLALRQRQFEDAISRMPPAAVQQWLSAAGPVLGLLGVML